MTAAAEPGKADEVMAAAAVAGAVGGATAAVHPGGSDGGGTVGAQLWAQSNSSPGEAAAIGGGGGALAAYGQPSPSALAAAAAVAATPAADDAAAAGVGSQRSSQPGVFRAKTASMMGSTVPEPSDDSITTWTLAAGDGITTSAASVDAAAAAAGAASLVAIIAQHPPTKAPQQLPPMETSPTKLPELDSDLRRKSFVSKPLPLPFPLAPAPPARKTALPSLGISMLPGVAASGSSPLSNPFAKLVLPGLSSGGGPGGGGSGGGAAPLPGVMPSASMTATSMAEYDKDRVAAAQQVSVGGDDEET